MTSQEVTRLPDRGTITASLGVTTPARIRSTLYDDYLPQLRGTRALRTYEEMLNDGTIAAIMFGIEMLIRNVEWTVERGDDTPASIAAEELVNEEQEAMAGTWGDFMSQVVTALPYGFAFFETVYRVRDDGRIGWEAHEFRPQTSLAKWLWEDGKAVAFIQELEHGGTATIPLAKGMHFRNTTASTAPEGRSILRRLYRTWFFKKRAEELLMVGLDKDLVGIPKAGVPAEVLEAGTGNPMYDAIKQVVTRTKQHNQAGIMWPSDVDPDTGQPKFTFDLMQSSGRPRVDPIPVVRMWATDLAAAVLAQFIMLGRDTTGSRALATPQQSLFESALSGWVSSFAEVIHQQGTQRLLAFNGLGDADVRIVPAALEETDIAGLATAAKDFAAALAALDTGDPNDPILAQVRTLLGFGAPPEDAMQDRANEQGGGSGTADQESEQDSGR